MNEDNQPNFEKAYKRLEEILERMNLSNISLDESLKLYEEAGNLIAFCNRRLNEAEQKIEILSKGADGSLSLDENQKPKLEEFIVQSSNNIV